MGRVSDKYRRRIAISKQSGPKVRGEVGKVLKEALQTATEEELYEVTPLPVTHAMRNSIQIFFLGANEVAAGYNARKAPHAKGRLNMKGVSKLGKHQLDMNPAPIVRREADNKIRQINRREQRRIIAGGS